MSTTYRKPSIRPAGPSRWIGVIHAHPLRAYFLITYLVTWSYWLVIYGLIGKAGELWAMPGVFVPALAAVLITGVLGGKPGLRVFLRSWIRWLVSPRWYVFTLLVLLALVPLTYIFLPDGAKGLERGALGVGLTYLATFIVILFVGGGQEEPGWHGFALPRLQRAVQAGPGKPRARRPLGNLAPAVVHSRPELRQCGIWSRSNCHYVHYLCRRFYGRFVAALDMVIQEHQWRRVARHAGACFGKYDTGI